MDSNKYIKITMEINGNVVKEQYIFPTHAKMIKDRWMKMVSLKNKDWKIYITIPSTMKERRIHRRLTSLHRLFNNSNYESEIETITDSIG